MINVLFRDVSSIDCSELTERNPASAPTSFLSSLFGIRSDKLTIAADEMFLTLPVVSVAGDSFPAILILLFDPRLIKLLFEKSNFTSDLSEVLISSPWNNWIPHEAFENSLLLTFFKNTSPFISVITARH